MPKKNSKLLTVKGIEKLRPPRPRDDGRDARVEYFDAGARSLCLRVTQFGAKSWAVHYTFEGKHHRITLGEFDPKHLGPEQARERAREIRRIAKDGGDPRLVLEAERRAKGQKMKAVATSRATFGPFAEQYIKRECAKLKRGTEREALIRKRLLPVWQDTPLADIGVAEAEALTFALVDAGKPAAAFQLYEVIKRMFAWGIERQRDWFKGQFVSPLGIMKPPVKKEPRQKLLSDADVRSIWDACPTLGYPSGPLVQLLLLTGQRRGEVAEMEWPEINLEKREWTIPASRAKNGVEHVVPLSDTALAVIAELPRFKRGEYVFTTTSGKRPVSGFAKFKERADRITGLSGWTFHDLRRVVRSGMAACRVPQEHAEHVLNHVPANLIKAYDRHPYEAEKREALGLWAARLRDITTPPPANVTALPARAAV